MTQPTGHPFPATGPGFAFPLSQRPRTFKHGIQTEYAAHRTRFESFTSEPSRWDDDISSISGDIDTCFGDFEDGSDRDQALEPLQLPALFWPSRGSKQIKAAIAKELQEGVIQQLPLSAYIRLSDFRRMTRQDVELRIKELWGYPGKSVQVDTILEVGCRQRSIIFVAKTGIGKSLIFEIILLLDLNHPGIALIIMPLKHIQQQQLEKVNRLFGARAVVYDGEHRSELLRYQIAVGHFTHGKEQ